MKTKYYIVSFVIFTITYIVIKIAELTLGGSTLVPLWLVVIFSLIAINTTIAIILCAIDLIKEFFS